MSSTEQNKKGLLKYTTPNYGSNVELKENASTTLPNSTTMHYQFDISQVSKQYLLICTNKSECMLNYPNIGIIDYSYTINKVFKVK